jgi:hypothetical protein
VVVPCGAALLGVSWFVTYGQIVINAAIAFAVPLVSTLAWSAMLCGPLDSFSILLDMLQSWSGMACLSYTFVQEAGPALES